MGWWGQREGSNYAFDVRLISVLKLYFSVNVILVMGCRAGEMDCKLGGGGGALNTERYCRRLWLADRKNFQILDALEWLKQ